MVVIIYRYSEDGLRTSDAFVIGVAGQYNSSLLKNRAKFNAVYRWLRKWESASFALFFLTY